MGSGANITYYGNGKGRWLKRVCRRQCPKKVFFYGRCQGVRGHKGVHWRYSASGDFEWDDNERDPKQDDDHGCAGSIPPGDESYPSPMRMQKRYYMRHYLDAEVTDKAVIAMLENGETPEPDASIDRPLSKEEAAELDLDCR